MKIYEQPEIQIEKFEMEDVITDSTPTRSTEDDTGIY